MTACHAHSSREQRERLFPRLSVRNLRNVASRLILTILGGGTYCATFGGAAGGSETNDDAQRWKIIDASAEGCPAP